MKTLYHLSVLPNCRVVRFALGEKKIPFELQNEDPIDRRTAFLSLNPAGDVPVLLSDDGTAISGAMVICEYLEEICPQASLFGDGTLARAEVRRLSEWFMQKFNHEVSVNISGEKLLKRFNNRTGPDAHNIRMGYKNLRIHLDYISWLLNRREWLAGHHLSLADMAAAAHLSLIDYLGEVPWGEYERMKNWYAQIKSRPAFRNILSDSIPGTTAPPHYLNPDF